MPGGRLVRAVLENLPALTHLNLARNRFTRSIAQLLNAALETNRSLRSLVLDSNGIDAVPAAAMADILTSHPALETLSLRFNSVRSDGAAAFARLLSTTPRTPLRQLDLRDNYIGDVGTRALLAAMGVRDTGQDDATAPGSAAAPPTTSAAAGSSRPSPSPTGAVSARGVGGCADDVDDDAPLAPAGSGVILAGSGAAALLALRRSQRERAARLGLLSASASAATLPPVPEVEADVAGESAAEATSVTSDGTVVQVATSSAAGEVGSGNRVVRLDGDTCARVFAAMTAPRPDTGSVGEGGVEETKSD